ncbi:MAG: hypothetical protein WBC78_00585 [Candidatus Sulfotelmatobacter sp.]
MKTLKSTLFLIALVCVSSGVSIEASDASAPSRTNLPKSGKTVLTVMSPKGKAEVTIETVQVNGECFDASPSANFMKEFGDTDEGSVVPHLSITVGGEAIFVPLSVYSRLSNINWASLSYKDGTFDLAIDENGDLSLVHIYFGPHGGVTRLTEYDPGSGAKTEDARFYYQTLR